MAVYVRLTPLPKAVEVKLPTGKNPLSPRVLSPRAGSTSAAPASRPPPQRTGHSDESSYSVPVPAARAASAKPAAAAKAETQAVWKAPEPDDDPYALGVPLLEHPFRFGDREQTVAFPEQVVEGLLAIESASPERQTALLTEFVAKHATSLDGRRLPRIVSEGNPVRIQVWKEKGKTAWSDGTTLDVGRADFDRYLEHLGSGQFEGGIEFLLKQGKPSTARSTDSVSSTAESILLRPELSGDTDAVLALNGEEVMPIDYGRAHQLIDEIMKRGGQDDAKHFAQRMASFALDRRLRAAKAIEAGSDEKLPVANFNGWMDGDKGTGKTTTMRMIGELGVALGLFNDVQVLRQGKLPSSRNEISDLVDQWAESKSFIIIDESHNFAIDGGDRTFVNEWVAAGDDDRVRGQLAMWFIGYSSGAKNMYKFMALDEGLLRRQPNHLSAPRPTLHFLLSAYEENVQKLGYTLSPEARRALEKMLARKRSHPSFANFAEVRDGPETAHQRFVARMQGLVGQELPRRSRNVSAEEFFDPIEFVQRRSSRELSPSDVGGVWFDEMAAARRFDLLASMRQSDVADWAAAVAKHSESPGSAPPTAITVLTEEPPGQTAAGRTAVSRAREVVTREVIPSVFRRTGLLYRENALSGGQDSTVTTIDAKSLLSQYVNESGINARKAVERAAGGILVVNGAPEVLGAQDVYGTGRDAVEALFAEAREQSTVLVFPMAEQQLNQLLARGDELAHRFTPTSDIEIMQVDRFTPADSAAVLSDMLTSRGAQLKPQHTERIESLLAAAGKQEGDEYVSPSLSALKRTADAVMGKLEGGTTLSASLEAALGQRNAGAGLRSRINQLIDKPAQATEPQAARGDAP